MLDSELHQAGEIADAKFMHQPAAVCFHGFGGEVEDVGNLGARLALYDQL